MPFDTGPPGAYLIYIDKRPRKERRVSQSDPADLLSIAPVAYARTPYPVKFGVPRQPGLVSGLEARIELVGPAAVPEAVRGLSSFSHVWVVWSFSHNAGADWTPTVRPPRLGGTQRMGVFATRSSFRPNGLALSCLRLLRVEERGKGEDGRECPVLHVQGADMVTGTPVYDIKPYLPFCDSEPGATGGWIEQTAWQELEVAFPPHLLGRVPEHLRAGLTQVLAQDPRPAYTRAGQEGRMFWVPLERVVVWFTVEKTVLTVADVRVLTDEEYERLRLTGTL
jgi:tRNA-Thr(GGU) m(6)t(6)A37 methyltransferase TsaA